MELTNDFVIDRGIEETWAILNDLEFIAPCMPGAQLTEIEGDEYRGLVKIKVGPITANYKGKASFVEQDTENHVAKLKAEGRDPRQGNANAMVTATLTEVTAAQTNVEIHTDLGLSGKIASFGRGAIEDVSKKILGQFVDNLRAKLAEGAAPAAAESAVVEAAAGSSDSGDDTTGAATAPEAAEAAEVAETPATGGVRKIDAPEPEAVDLLAVGGNEMAKRLVPAGVVGAIVIAFIWWLVSRG